MKSFLIQIGSQILRDAFSPSDGSGGLITALLARPKEKPQATIEPDFEYFNGAALLFVRRILMGVICGVFLIAGALATVFSATQSYDSNGQFVATSTFVAAALITVFSLVGVLVARSQVLKVSFSWKTFLRGASQFPVSSAIAQTVMEKEMAPEEAEEEEETVVPSAPVEVLPASSQKERLAS